MQKIIKGFTEFINEGLDAEDRAELGQLGFPTRPEPRLMPGEEVNFPNFMFLSDDQLSDLDVDLSDQQMELVNGQMEEALYELVPGDPARFENGVYFDVEVDLENRTYSLLGVYEIAEVFSYSLEIGEPLELEVSLPITLALPDLLIQSLDKAEADSLLGTDEDD